MAALWRGRGVTLTALSRRTGISLSTLSRLESGQRRATLDLLLPLAREHGVSLDELVGRRADEDTSTPGAAVRTEDMIA